MSLPNPTFYKTVNPEPVNPFLPAGNTGADRANRKLYAIGHLWYEK